MAQIYLSAIIVFVLCLAPLQAGRDVRRVARKSLGERNSVNNKVTSYKVTNTSRAHSTIKLYVFFTVD
ncbi:MAG TPA: hypothetical protein PL115_01100 [Bacteroidales bacterium]|jgi:hypothetical protein|nr:hypothetical protein [Bacteroidales bacterium]